MTILEQLRARFTPADFVRLGSSLVLALLMWGWVTAREDPQTTRAFPNVAVEAGELPDGLVVVSAPPDVLIRLSGPRSVIIAVTSSEVTAHLDLEGIDAPGTYNVAVIVSTPDGVWAKRAAPSQVQIEVDRSVAQQFPVDPQLDSQPGANRRVKMIPDASEVTVRGPSSIVARVAKVILPVTIGNETRDFVDAFTPVAQDASGQQIAEVTIQPNPITTTVEIEAAGKSIAVFTQLVGSPATGLEVLDQTVNPSTVIIDGPQELLDNIVIAQTVPVDISGADQNISQRVGLQDLPEGVSVIEPAGGQVEVFIQIGQRGVRQILTGLAVDVTNLTPGLSETASPTEVSVVVVASADNLARLTADDITIQVDLAGLGPGDYTLRPTVSLPPNVQWISTDPPRVTVTISAAPAPALNATPVASPSSAQQ